MKLVKSLLLGSAAGIAAVAGAQAADLPSRKAAPVEYVRVCSAFGAGFFYIPGTDTCLRVGGRVRAEYTFGERWSAGQDSFGTRARGRIYIDARNQTAYGTLRTFVRYDLTTSTGSYRYNGTNAGANRMNGVNGANDEAAALDSAFVQLGPLTAGKIQSFYSFYANDYGFQVLRTSDRQVNVLAYTATFGGGFSATISLEDPKTTGRRGTSQFIEPTTGLRNRTAYQGTTYPDVVASLRVDQGWGSAQLSGAIGDRSTYSSPYLRQDPTLNAADTLGSVVNGVSGTGRKKNDMGWAIQGGVKINLPMLAAGDAIFLQAGYADGAIEYLGWNGTAGIGYGRLPAYGPVNFGRNAAGNLKSTTGYNLVAALRHYWTPSVRSDFLASYSALSTNDFDVAATVGIGDQRNFNPKELLLGANLVWSPVAGLDIGVEVLYSRVEYGRRIMDAKTGALNAAATGVAGIGGANAALAGYSMVRSIKSDDAWTGRLRIQRDF
ncbi:porin [Bosea sp. MMO-172]|uniref:porin n=1 Tax=Bosea sp. MMO-172 TaxID=3127885 RepID=UPI003016DBF2